MTRHLRCGWFCVAVCAWLPTAIWFVITSTNPYIASTSIIMHTPSQKFIFYLLFITLVLFLANCSSRSKDTLAYPEPKPDTTALQFLPGIVCSDSLDFNLALSADAKTLYFSRSRGGKWLILQSDYNNGAWSSPTTAPFSENAYSQADPFVAADGTIYYISNRPRDESDTIPDFDIWYVKPQGNNKWSAPVNVAGVNTDSTEFYVSLSANGNLYFASNRAGGFGKLDIYVSRLAGGKYSTPENLGPAINTETNEHDPLIIGDEQFIIFNSFERKDSFGEADLYYSSRNNNAWVQAVNMGPVFNTPTFEYCPNLSPDGRYFFFSSELDVKWIASDKLPFAVGY